MLRARQNSERDSWLIAWALALALHVVAILVFGRVSPLRAANVPRRPEPVQLVFVGPGTQKSRPQDHKPEAPHAFTELPVDRADATPPRDAAFLSNVTSRARDNVPGGDEALPRMTGVSDVPMVKLEPDGGPSRPPSPSPAPRSPEPPTPRAAESPAEASAPAAAPTQAQADAGAGSVSPPASSRPASDAGGPPATDAPHASSGATGNSDIRQPEMDNPGGNAGLRGDVSLNTTAWNYAPWLQTFGRHLMRRWIPPPAYSMGILKEGGWVVIEVEISKAGKMLRLDVLEEQGHPSLSQAAQNALGSLTPIEPLPADFPEPTLILRVRMIYPKIRPRW